MKKIIKKATTLMAYYRVPLCFTTFVRFQHDFHTPFFNVRKIDFKATQRNKTLKNALVSGIEPWTCVEQKGGKKGAAKLHQNRKTC